MIKLMIVDDHTLLRQGLRRMLELYEELEVVGEAADGEEAIKKLEDLQPDVIILDLNMPKLSGLEVVRLVKTKYPAIQLLILTMHEDESYMLEATRAGALGYLLKDVEANMLVQAIRRVAAGEHFIYPTLVGRMVEEFTKMSRQIGEFKPRNFQPRPITTREMEILKLLVRGLTNQEIAAAIYLSEKTIKNHLTSLFRKFAVSDRTQAVLYAIRHKIIDDADQTSTLHTPVHT